MNGNDSVRCKNVNTEMKNKYAILALNDSLKIIRAYTFWYTL